jgi:hypothetical protein
MKTIRFIRALIRVNPAFFRFLGDLIFAAFMLFALYMTFYFLQP